MINVVIISGGSNAEFKVSLNSAYNISKEIYTHNSFNFFNIIILPNKRWIYSNDFQTIFINPDNLNTISYNTNLEDVFQIGDGKINDIKIDCAILPLLGTIGEDGEIQGFLKMNSIPHTGTGILGSAIGLDKEISKILVQNVGISVVPWITLYKNEDYDKNKIIEYLGKNIIVKISNGGSSVGVFEADDQNIDSVIKQAFDLNNKILLEKNLIVRELSIGFIGNKYSLIGEGGQVCFRNYEYKYLVKRPAPIIPTIICPTIQQNIICYAKKIKKCLNLDNFGRIDFFLAEGKLYFNEVNTHPAFTSTSLFPLLWKASGKDYINIIKEIVDNAINPDM